MVLSWDSMLRTARAVVWVLAIMFLALVIPPQTRDMLSGTGWSNILSRAGWSIISFHLALFCLGLSAWHWGRAALSARFHLRDTHAARKNGGRTASGYTADRNALVRVPRLFFLFASLIGVLAVLKSGAYWQLIVIALWTIPGLWLLHARLRIQHALFKRMDLTSAPDTDHVPAFVPWPLRTPWRSCHRVLGYAPFGPGVALVLIIIAVLAFTGGLAASLDQTLGGQSHGWWAWLFQVPTFIAKCFPGPGAALFCAGLLIGPLTLLTFHFDRWHIGFNIFGYPWGLKRPPVVISVLALVALTTFLVPLHGVRLAAKRDLVIAPSARVDLATYFKAWKKRCAVAPDADGVIHPIIVSISGGAARAGLWGARVLQAVDKVAASAGTGVFAISSVSGGSLGTASYLSMLAGQNGAGAHPCSLNAAFEPTQPVPSGAIGRRGQATIDALRSDALGPALSAVIMEDLPRGLFGIPIEIGEAIRHHRQYVYFWHGGDRAQALETAFESNWRAAVKKAGLSKSAGAPVPFGAPYLSLFYAKDNNSSQAHLRGYMPLWIANGTDTESGDRILTLPVAPSRKGDTRCDGDPRFWPFYSARDALGLIGTDIPISTAIDNTSRFPFLSPSGEFPLVPVDADGRRLPAPANCASRASLTPPGWMDKATLSYLLAKISGNKDAKAAEQSPAGWPSKIGVHSFLRAIRLPFALFPTRQVIDGGYFDNEGMTTALDLATWLENRDHKVQPILIQVTDDGDDDLGDNGQASAEMRRAQIRCDNPFVNDPNAKTHKTAVSEFLIPFIGISNVRSGHTTALMNEVRASYCAKAATAHQAAQPQRFFHFYLYGPNTHDLPLNWVMSEWPANYIWNCGLKIGGNRGELHKLEQVLDVPQQDPDGAGRCKAIWKDG